MHCSNRPGKLIVIGIGPGGAEHRTARAVDAIKSCNVVVGYRQYLDSIADLLEGKELVSSGMMQEAKRCRAALERAQAGDTVAFVSSGDAGIYGMAGLAIEMAEAEGFNIPIEIVPGVTASSAAGASLGAPLMLDYASISLSDLLVPWENIRKRLEHVAAADLVVALYNPKSTKRVTQIEEAAEIFRKHRPGSTPVGIVTAAGCEHEVKVLSTLDEFLKEEIGMRSIVIIGNSTSRVVNGFFITPRGYKLTRAEAAK